MASTDHSDTRPTRHFNNWISAIGAVLAIAALFSFALLVWMDFTQGDKNPYLGIFTYLVAPGFLITGLGLVFFGAWAQRRWEIKHSATDPDHWRLNFADTAQRRRLLWFAAGAAGFIMLSAFGSYQTYHYSESTVFCGQVCHSAMNPEFVAYQRTAHALVDCVECHVGEGTKHFIEAKLAGTRQLVSFILDNYNRPIPTPVENLRPARDTCEQCHWPDKQHGTVEMEFAHFLSDKANTAYTARLLMHVNRPMPGGHPGGIHWHVGKTERVEYYATDPQRLEIPWVRVTNTKSGEVKVFRTPEFKEEPPADHIRQMDCIDCHNRPAHDFPTANDSVERAMVAGTLTTKLPNIKRVAVQAMTQKEIARDADAADQIAKFIQGKYSDPAVAAEVPGAIAEVQKIFASTMFVERKADWRAYPNHIGHKNSPGCFRCHDEKHKTETGVAVRASDCSSCHTIVAQGQGEALQGFTTVGLDFKHPEGELDPELTCADCHNGGIQK